MAFPFDFKTEILIENATHRSRRIDKFVNPKRAFPKYFGKTFDLLTIPEPTLLSSAFFYPLLLSSGSGGFPENLLSGSGSVLPQYLADFDKVFEPLGSKIIADILDFFEAVHAG